MDIENENDRIKLYEMIIEAEQGLMQSPRNQFFKVKINSIKARLDFLDGSKPVEVSAVEFNYSLRGGDKITNIETGVTDYSFNYNLTQSQFDIIQFLATKKIDSNFNTYYVINDVKFEVLPTFKYIIK